MPDTAFARCSGKIQRTRPDAIIEATRIGFPVAPYLCPNGYDHWHVGKSWKNGKLFHNKRDWWEAQPRNQERKDG